MEWAQILVITLAVALVIFLVLAIILTIKLIQISRQIRRITNTAERAAVKVESVVNSAAAMVAPAAIAKIIKSMMYKTKKHKNKED
jgi:hypothetical protein